MEDLEVYRYFNLQVQTVTSAVFLWKQKDKKLSFPYFFKI